MTQARATQQRSERSTDNTAIRPFHVKFPEAQLADLRRRINATKWPEREQVTDTRHNLPPGGFFDVRGIKIPVAVSAFAEEIYQAPKSWAEKAYPKLIYYNSFPKGTHFAAWEQPKLFTEEMRIAFRSLR